MRTFWLLPAVFSGIIFGAIVTIIALPTTQSGAISAAGADPKLLFLLSAVIIIPSTLYALMRFEDGKSRSKSSDALPQNVMAARGELEKQFAQFLALVGEQIKSSERHTNDLDALSGRLKAVNSEPELRSAIQALIVSNEAYRRETAELERRLERAQTQAKELRRRAKNAEKLASVDPLTNIANRRKFDEELEKQVALSHQEETPLCLMMVDIDHFKLINDEFGHRAGDAVLRQFAELLSGMVRATDLIARYGGEEFAIILPRAPLGNAYEIAERIQLAIQSHPWNDSSTVVMKLTSSFGIADIRDGENAVDLVNRADSMLYEAKKHGRNRTMIWHSAA
ncbi:MAG: diguanylate cyclase [Hyphomicrobium sp.]|uniref:GGDEF domain-containing protein n=1 Tax=Hyphomicrobium sp. TaxID=82 RepID=UPI0039E54065